MDINLPLPHDYSPSTSLSSTPPHSITSSNKQKIKTLPPPLTSAVSLHSTSANSANLSNNFLSAIHSKCMKSTVPSLVATLDSGGKPPTSGHWGQPFCPSQWVSKASQLAHFNDALGHMLDVMENQNLLFKAPVADPTNGLNLAHMHVASIQADQLGNFTIEEKKRTIQYVLSSPTTAQAYEVLEHNEVLHAWLHQEALS